MSCFSCTCGLGGVELQTPDPARRGQAPAVWCPLRAQGAPGPPEPICTRLTSFAAAWEPAALDAVFPSAWAWATLTSQPTSLGTRGADHRPGVLGGAGGARGSGRRSCALLCRAPHIQMWPPVGSGVLLHPRPRTLLASPPGVRGSSEGPAGAPPAVPGLPCAA